jgi:quinol-cytochrome oxidoreductase complex cytochrome b subunit
MAALGLLPMSVIAAQLHLKTMVLCGLGAITILVCLEDLDTNDVSSPVHIAQGKTWKSIGAIKLLPWIVLRHR